uniref:TLC domain-containing protein n=1 Tax=Rhizophora mucronata TaxID=61149 RepID=A0A2P2JZR3_RHIMU
MILWRFPELGGLEYVLHHCLSMYSILLSLISGQGQIYILMVLFTEITTPFVNLRWYLDSAGQKNSKLYICNGVMLFLVWLCGLTCLHVQSWIKRNFHIYNN